MDKTTDATPPADLATQLAIPTDEQLDMGKAILIASQIKRAGRYMALCTHQKNVAREELTQAEHRETQAANKLASLIAQL